jgi:endonuclease YncB( thermonuclease family)
MKKLILVILLLSSFCGFGQTLDSTYIRGVVAAVRDGDSYKIRFDKDTIWVRLAFVDAPEVNSNHICATQEMGREIGDFVRSELKGKTVYVKFLATDVYNRPVVRINYNDQDYSTRLVMKGLAWVVDTKELSKEEYKILAEYKKMAFKNRLGIFINSKAITPALFRKRNRCTDKAENK